MQVLRIQSQATYIQREVRLTTTKVDVKIALWSHHKVSVHMHQQMQPQMVTLPSNIEILRIIIRIHHISGCSGNLHREEGFPIVGDIMSRENKNESDLEYNIS